MARNRMIKPEFWTSEQILNCSPMARLMFIGIWNFSDDNGVHPASYKKLKAEIFPTDDYSTVEIQSWISELIQQELLCEYIVADKTYWMVTGWKKHQTIKYPTYLYPIESIHGEQPANMIERSGSIEGRLMEDCSTTSSTLIKDCGSTPIQIKINKIKENKEKQLREVGTSPACVSSSSSNEAIIQLFSYWQCVMSHPRAVLDKKRKRAIEHALQLGYTISELQQAIDGCKNTSFNMGQNDRNQLFDDITLILRDAEHIERFIATGDKPTAELDSTSNDLMSGVI